MPGQRFWIWLWGQSPGNYFQIWQSQPYNAFGGICAVCLSPLTRMTEIPQGKQPKGRGPLASVISAQTRSHSWIFTPFLYIPFAK